MTTQRTPPATDIDLPELDLRASGLRAGTPVEVWCASLSEWVRGFAVDDVSVGGVTVTRLSDAVVLPEQFPPSSVRVAAARSKSSAWH